MSSVNSLEVITFDLAAQKSGQCRNDFFDAIHNGIRDQYIKVEDSMFPEWLHRDMANATISAFQWPQDMKVELSKHTRSGFLGFTSRGNETTNGVVDNREVFDFAMVDNCSMETGLAMNSSSLGLIGLNEWPDANIVGPEFKQTVEAYMFEMRKVYRSFLKNLEAALELPLGSLQDIENDTVPHRLKLVKYFPSRDAVSQGVGAHQDETGWFTFVAEVDQPGLEVHTSVSNSWHLAPLSSSQWGLNIGKAFERATFGAIDSTLHRVVAPSIESGPRHSIVFFAGLPLGQTYESLREILDQSPVLQRLHRQEDTRSPEFLKELSSLPKEACQASTFGQTQLDMWKRSYKVNG